MNKRIKTAMTVWFAVVLAAAALQPLSAWKTSADAMDEQAQEISTLSRTEPEPIPGRLIVKYRPGVSSRMRTSLMMAGGAREERAIPEIGIQIMTLPEGANQEAYVQDLRSRPEVEFVEQDYLVYPADEMIPDDPLYSSQWHLPIVSCPTAWSITGGSDEVIIAICDTGVDSSHPDLASKLVPGWNVVDNNADTSPVTPHGTWTSGTAAATGNNSLGVASPALNCLIMPMRISSRSDGAALISDMAEAVIWAADHGARVASVSYMGAGSGMMASAGSYIQSKGGVLVMSSGNTGTYTSSPDSPSILVVGATTQSDGLAAYSTTGSHVDLSAPGSAILTTSPGGTYQAVSGTSFSAPLVAGTVGLMFSINPNLTPAQIDEILKVSADDFGSAGWDSGFGWGRLDVGRAIEVVDELAAGAGDSTPPAVGFRQPQIGGPANGLIGISGGELVKVSALDDRGVSEVSLFLDGVLVGTTASAPYNFLCDTAAFASGSQHTLITVATDATGNSTSISTTVTPTTGFDATPPTVDFVRPQTNGQVAISANESVQISASDNLSVTSVSLIADGVLVGTLTAAPYEFNWDTSSFSIGSQHTLVVIAGDQAGNSTTLNSTVTAAAPQDNTPPVVSFQQPLDGGTVSESQGEQIIVSASDNIGVTCVSLYADGALVGTDTSAPYEFSWNTSSLAAGSRHTLRAVAADQAGNSTAVSIAVTVRASGDTIAPRVWFTNPKNGDRIKGEVKVTIGASDNVAVTRVEFYTDNRLFTSWTRAPYSVKWKAGNASRGNHTLKCIAFDAAGNSTATSIIVNVR